jgi:hypothetical protein
LEKIVFASTSKQLTKELYIPLLMDIDQDTEQKITIEQNSHPAIRLVEGRCKKLSKNVDSVIIPKFFGDLERMF